MSLMQRLLYSEKLSKVWVSSSSFWILGEWIRTIIRRSGYDPLSRPSPG